MPMTYHKLSYVISFTIPIIHVLFVEIKMNINRKMVFEDFCNIRNWFVDNKTNIYKIRQKLIRHKDKTKLIHFAFKFKVKNVTKLNRKYGDTKNKQHS